jgi:hypothetical protein
MEQFSNLDTTVPFFGLLAAFALEKCLKNFFLSQFTPFWVSWVLGSTTTKCQIPGPFENALEASCAGGRGACCGTCLGQFKLQLAQVYQHFKGSSI